MNQQWYFVAIIVVSIFTGIALTPEQIETREDQICIVHFFSETCYDREIHMEFTNKAEK